MTQTITALFDTRADADAAKERLKQSSVNAGHISIHDKSSAGYKDTGYSTAKEPGMWGSIKHAFLPDEDRHTYEEGVRRGGFLLTADVDDGNVDDAVKVLEQANTVDIDDRASQWRSAGWDYDAAKAGGAGYGVTGSTPKATDTGGEQVIPIVEEELVVGKREVSRGGARVRSYVTEVPVHEQVRLRDEKIEVARRAADRPLTDADDAFRERTIDVTATGEEAVVGKTARVVEEVVVSKSVGERVEQIDDSVRRTDVEIDRDPGTADAKGDRR